MVGSALRHLFVMGLFVGMVSSGLNAGSNPVAEPKERAVTALEEDVKTDPNNAELWVHLGFAYHKSGQNDQAKTAFEKARSLNPRSRDALFMLGLIYEKKRQSPEAVQVWKEYLSVESDSAKREIAEKHIHHLTQ
jgi:cytochrome c-type biogenesis protein CcmH/NrfG